MLINLFNVTFGCWLFSFMNQGYNGWIKIFSFIRQCAGQGSTRWKLKTVCPVNSKGRSMGLQLEIENSQVVIQGQKRSTKARTDIWRPRKIAGGQKRSSEASKSLTRPKKVADGQKKISEGHQESHKAKSDRQRPSTFWQGQNRLPKAVVNLGEPSTVLQAHGSTSKAIINLVRPLSTFHDVRMVNVTPNMLRAHTLVCVVQPGFFALGNLVSVHEGTKHWLVHEGIKPFCKWLHIEVIV